MTVACGLISSIFIGQAIVMLITVGVELHCGFNILCVLETLSPLPLMGRIPHMRHGAIVVDFETGMMDNIVGALSGYLSAIIITVWALTRHHHWLALRLSAVVAAAIIALIASQITVYNHIKDRVDSSTIDLLVECTSPQGIVGLAAIWSTGMLMRDSKRWPRDKERLVLSWTVTAAKLLLSAVTLFELAFAVTDIVAPVAAGEMFHTLTGYSPSRLLSLGFSIPRSAATIVVGSSLSHLLAIAQKRMHRHTVLLLTPSALFHIAMTLSLAASIVGQRRLHRTKSQTQDPNRVAAIECVYAIFIVISALTSLVFIALVLIMCTRPQVTGNDSDDLLRSAPAGADDDVIEMHTRGNGSIRNAVLTLDSSDDDSSTAASSTESSFFEPVPSRARLTDSTAAAECIAEHLVTEDPVPARARLLS
jgi:hypothetical protein